MSKIERIEVMQVDLIPKVVRTDAIQAFTKQETPIVRITTDDGIVGTGYAYTVGTGGSAVIAMIRDDLAPALIGRDAQLWSNRSGRIFSFTSMPMLLGPPSACPSLPSIWPFGTFAAKRQASPSGGLPVAHRNGCPCIQRRVDGSTSRSKNWSTAHCKQRSKAFWAANRKSASPVQPKTLPDFRLCAKRSALTLL